MSKRKNIYCYYCGTKNDIKDKKCISCNKKLNDKDHEFRNYVLGKSLDEAYDQIEETIFDFIKAFLKKYLYGIAISISVVGAVAVTVLNNNEEIVENYSIVNESYVLQKVIEGTLKCPDGYNLEKDKCIKNVMVNAVSTKSCDPGYDLKNNNCISKQSFEKIENKTCEIPSGFKSANGASYRDAYIHVDGNCYVPICSKFVTEENKNDPAYLGYDVGECVEGGAERVEFTIKYSCEQGTLVDGFCKNIIKPKTEYSCTEGKLDGKNCVLTESLDADIECPENYILDPKSKMCLKDKEK